MSFHLLHATQRQFSHFFHIIMKPGPYITRNVRRQAVPMPNARARDPKGFWKGKEQ